MTIGRISGPSLKSDLDRQGVDLDFTTDSKSLLSLNFSQFRAAINTSAFATTETFTVEGSSKLANVKISDTTISSNTSLTLTANNGLGDINVGPINHIKISGGAPNHVMVTDGSGNLAWQDMGSLSQLVDLTGMQIGLGTPSDTSLVVDAAYKQWSSGTKVTDAEDILNRVLLNVYNGTFVSSVDFTANTTTGSNPLAVTFTSTVVGNPNRFEWNFGDGNSLVSTSGSVSHTYNNTAGGSFDVYVKALNTDGPNAGNSPGCYAEVSKPGYIQLFTNAPNPSFTLDRTTLNEGDTVSLTNTSQYADSYLIYWGDGQITSVSSNMSVGGPSGTPATHQYFNVLTDSRYNVYIQATSSTAAPGGISIDSAVTQVSVFNAHTSTFTATPTSGNNQHTLPPNGLTVTFTNTTVHGPANTSLFSGNHYIWDFGDGTTQTVNIGVSAAGDAAVPLVHTYTLSNPTIGQVFNVTLTAVNGNTASPFISPSTPITVNVAPTAAFTGTALAVSDRIGDTAQTGYLFTDLNGVQRNVFHFTNQSINTDTYLWDFSNGVTDTLQNPADIGYAAQGTYSVSLQATGPTSLTSTDDTVTKSAYIDIKLPPAPPDGLGAKTLSLTSEGASPLLAANATVNTISPPPPSSSSVIRVTTGPVATSLLLDVYNANAGSLSAYVNGVVDGTVTLAGGNDVGTYGALVVTADVDAHTVNQALYPSNFYKVFSGQVARSNVSLPVGVNSYDITHSTTGSTPELQFVKDSVTQVPQLNIASVTATVAALGSAEWISGIPYFATGGQISVAGLSVTNWIGQTYRSTSTPLTVQLSALGSTAATFSYASIEGSVPYLVGGVPTAETGSLSAYILGNLIIPVTGTSQVPVTATANLLNVNGVGTTLLPITLNVTAGSTPPGWMNEWAIPVRPTLGSGYTDSGKRVYIAGTGPTPAFNPALDYYTNSPFTGSIAVSTSDEAILRHGTVTNDTTDYSTYLPPGPNLSGRTGSQFFRFAFHRTVMANFTVKYSGKITSLTIAAPGTQIDSTSTNNGWLTASVPYAGVGVPGGNTIAGGNGSDGCAKTAGDVLPAGILVTNHSSVLTLGSENASNAFANEILVCVELAPGDSLTSISIE